MQMIQTPSRKVKLSLSKTFVIVRSPTCTTCPKSAHGVGSHSALKPMRAPTSKEMNLPYTLASSEFSSWKMQKNLGNSMNRRNMAMTKTSTI